VRAALDRAATGMALLGGLALLGIALLTTASVLRRWITSDPIPGDFEMVQLGAGLAVFGFLAYGTLKRTNILVDSFTTWLPPRATAWIDAFWSLAWAVAALLLAERMTVGALDTLRSGTQTMVLALPTWWVVGFGALAFALTGLVALWWVRALLRGPAESAAHGG
jgi:TRAP-type C4-dicarboxylate transport system permease small subunit